MKLSRLLLAVVAGFCLLRPAPLLADSMVSPFGASQQFSVDMLITTKDGTSMSETVFSDSGKLRTEPHLSGDAKLSPGTAAAVSIVRPDRKKAYMLTVAQKMAIEMPLNAEQAQLMDVASKGKFESIGPDTVDGVACTKYKMTSEKEGKVFFFWISTATKAPVKMQAEDGSVTIAWKNYKAGPQDPALFEVPSDYTIMKMPGMGGAPASGDQ